MSGASKLGDMASGHEGWPPHPITSGSANVNVNGTPAAKVGDTLAIHGAPPPFPPHPGAIMAGSSTVNINGSPAARIGDDISCGGVIIQGSANVVIGG